MKGLFNKAINLRCIGNVCFSMGDLSCSCHRYNILHARNHSLPLQTKIGHASVVAEIEGEKRSQWMFGLAPWRAQVFSVMHAKQKDDASHDRNIEIKQHRAEDVTEPPVDKVRAWQTRAFQPNSTQLYCCLPHLLVEC